MVQYPIHMQTIPFSQHTFKDTTSKKTTINILLGFVAKLYLYTMSWKCQCFHEPCQ